MVCTAARQHSSKRARCCACACFSGVEQTFPIHFISLQDMGESDIPAESNSEGISNVLVNENGSRNKQKFLSDTSLDNQFDASIQSLLEDFPTHENEKLLKDFTDEIREAEEEEEFLKEDWDDPIACQLQELLIHNLLTIFTAAVKKTVESGYTAEVAEWAILNSGLFHGSKDSVSNVADGALALLKGEKEFNNTSSKYSVFKEMKNLASYIMLEMIHVLREVRPTLTIAEAMWCLLISDLNLLNACVVDKLEVMEDGSALPEPKFESSVTVHSDSKNGQKSQPKKSDSGTKAQSDSVKESPVSPQLGKGKLSASTAVDEKAGDFKKGSTANSKRDLARRQKAFQLEKNCKGRISKAAFKSKVAAWGSMVIDKSQKSISVSSTVVTKGSHSKGTITVVESSSKSQTGVPAPVLSDKGPLPASKEENTVFNPLKVINYNVTVPEDETDETVLLLVSHKKALERELQGWTDWANGKVMEVAKRLAKDRGELKILKQEKEECEKIEKDKQTLEVNTTKRESGKAIALSNSTGQIEVANCSLRRIEEENLSLKMEMKGVELQALKSGHRLQEAVVREQEVMKKVQLCETEKGLLVEKLRNYKNKTNELKKHEEKAKERLDQFKVLLKHEEKEKKKIAAQVETLRAKKEEENNLIEQEAQNIRQAAETNLQKCKKDICNLEKLISELKLESNKSKIAALSVGYGSSLTGSGTQLPKIPKKRLAVFQDNFRGENVKPERECVMCMTEEISVVFLPCAHQVLCGECSVRHEKEGMNDCPSCRAKIEKRVLAQCRV